MTVFDMWIGNLDDPGFDWNGGNWNDNVPKRESPSFPYSRGYYFLSNFFEWVEQTGCEYKQTDWGGWVNDPEILAAALLHDTLEDTDTSPEDLEPNFGEKVLNLVQEVTDDKRLEKGNRKASKSRGSSFRTYIHAK